MVPLINIIKKQERGDATSGRDLCYAKLIPNRGAWLEFETSNKNIVSVKVDRKRKIPITTLLRAIDTDPDITDEQGSLNFFLLMTKSGS